ncbi:DUF4263 domain-containing protein [Bacillus altitudinis]|uniref:Shedu anti-phage system protein SduA domain-containing protein n=1 Tax=Bacillus altitudinis TaxID=293387 RepID=UPI0010FF83C6|nr:DUF4263 domain-containing protein [Bacillus altitudinis]
MIPEFQIGNYYQADFLLIGRSSGGHELVFVEFEHPNKNITINSGHLGEAFRKGINQVKDWRSLIQRNYSTISDTLYKYKSPIKTL